MIQHNRNIWLKMCISIQKQLLESHRLQMLKKRHLKLKLPPIPTHIIQQDNNHSKKWVGNNNIMSPVGSRDDTNKETSGKIIARHGNIQVQHGITRINNKFNVTRKQLDHVSTYPLDGWNLMHGHNWQLFLVYLIVFLPLMFRGRIMLKGGRMLCT